MAIGHRFETLVVVGLLACAGGPARGEADTERGRSVVLGGIAGAGTGAGVACHTCHGLDGTGDGSGAFPRLTGQADWYLYKQLQDYASGLRPNAVMTPIAKAMSRQQMEDVSRYYAAQTAPPLATTRRHDPALIQRGAAISAAGLADKGIAACVNCHGPSGQGIAPSFPYIAGQYAPYTALQLTLWKEGTRRNSPLGVMRHISEQLDEADIEALAAYLETLPPPAEPLRLRDATSPTVAPTAPLRRP